MTKKKNDFKPEALDADGDGVVQEGTEFERPAEPVFKSEAEFVAVKSAKVHVVVEGDSWASLGKLYAPKGVSGFAHAQRLMALNGNKALVAGVEVVL